MIQLTKEERKIRKKFMCAKKNLVLMMTKKKYYKVREHCHYTGRYRGATHDICNLRYKNTKRNYCGIS